MLQTLGMGAGRAFGYAAACSAPQSLHRQHSVLVHSGVAVDRIYCEQSPHDGQRPALAALTECTAEGDSVAVLGFHRLGHTASEIVHRLIEFNERGIALHVLRNTVQAPAIGGADLHLDDLVGDDVVRLGQPFGRSRPIGRPRILTASTTAFARQMIDDGVSKTAVAKALGVSRPTLYKALACG